MAEQEREDEAPEEAAPDEHMEQTRKRGEAESRADAGERDPAPDEQEAP